MQWVFKSFLVLGVVALSACTQTVDVSVSFPETRGLGEGDQVVFQGKKIGEVASVTPSDSGVTVRLALESEPSRAIQSNAAAIVAETDPRTVEVLNPPATGEAVTDGTTLEGLGTPLELALWRAGTTVGAAGQGLVDQLNETFDRYFDSTQWEQTKADIHAQLDAVSDQSATAIEGASTGLKAFLAELETESTELIADAEENLAELQQKIETFQQEGQAQLAESLRRILEQLESAVSEQSPPSG
jgi:ABC-type transporter Mla subunit MlaD